MNFDNDPALADFSIASKVARRREKRSAQQALSLKHRSSIANSLQFIADSVQQDRDERPVLQGSGDLFAGYRKGIVAQRAIERIGCDDMREDELLESVDAILQFLEMALSNSGHNGEPFAGADANQPMPAGDPAHRLSETQK